MTNRQQLMARLVATNQQTPRYLRSESADGETRMYVYDVIDPMWGVGAESFVKALNDVTDKTIHLHINSPGGDVFEARAMVTALRAHPANVIAHIDGVAASAASYLAMAGDSVEMAEGAFLMVHKAWGMVIGNSDDLRTTADLLDKIDGSIVDEYMKRTDASQEQVQAWMAAETWFTAQEALDAKFVDSIADGSVKNAAQWNLSAFGEVPEKLQAARRQEQEDIDRQARERRIEMVLQGIN